MESRGIYQNMNDFYRQQYDNDQTELYEYDNERNSTVARIRNLFGPTLLQKPPRILRRAPNLIDSLPSNVDRTLLYAKIFYFWYFAAFGSLFPLLSIYFKQMGMGPSYCGILMGFRPFVEFVSAPFWSVVSTRFRQAKNILLMALLSWIVFTVAIGLINPPPHSCWREMNSTHQTIERVNYKTTTINPNIRTPMKRSLITMSTTISLKDLKQTTNIIEQRKNITLNKTNTLEKNLLNATMNRIINITLSTSKRIKTTTFKTTQLIKIANNSNNNDDDDDYDDEDDDVETAVEDNSIDENRQTTTISNEKQSNTNNFLHINTPKKTIGNPISITVTNLSLVKPLASPVLYEQKDVRNVFMVFLLLIIIGEFFSAPAITLADAYTLAYLAQDTELYGRQRMFGSIGWGLAIFIVAMILDQSKSLTFYACGTSGPLEKNYTVCFAAFTICMIFAFITATRFQYSYNINEQVPLNVLNQDLKRTVYPTTKLNTTEHNIHSIVNDEEQIQINVKEQQYKLSNTMKLMQIIQIFMALKNGTFLFIAWWMGCGVGLVFTFLFWHLQDLGGSPTLFGVASVINHTSELFAYFFLHELIHRFGHIKILYLGLLGNFIRFVYISIITNPWWVLPFEFIQGLTHAAVWATACSYLSQAAPESLRVSCQGVLQGFHFGFGRGCGALFGGFFASYFGTDITFRAYGIICLIFMGLFIYINKRHHQQIVSGYGQNINVDDTHQFMGNSPLLAPYGAPANPKWQTKFSSGLTAGIKQDQLHSTPIPPFDTQTTTGTHSKDYHYGY
ncbi:unnamed protein product [Rotaria sp. Silwood2]|nr:unnamed protein product [Rotaria sp. Silwood2]CAF2465117.1 unnamed protein product [Rotaria sp. Silwood2]CAF2854166.1 unnamed protein product [Rotaria sp. Silwood2]CAF3899992.1 unnamed protein product [Rotaria sp. Silwood2]CAF4102526.1 unnamed protein product [Rotaria sp. Silwood2]